MNEYNWVVYYADGSKLTEKKEDGTLRSTQDIDRSKLKIFQLFDGEVLKYSLFLKEGQRFIFRRRKTINCASQVLDIVYLIGYQFNDTTGKNYKVLNYVHIDGLIEMDDDRSDLVLLQEEEIK
jgi:hypothetical protein